MDDLSSAIFYPIWNQAIAATVKRFPPIDTYHINGVFWRYNISTQKLQLSRGTRPSLSPIQGFAMLSVVACRIPGSMAKEEMKEVCLVGWYSEMMVLYHSVGSPRRNCRGCAAVHEGLQLDTPRLPWCSGHR